MRPAPRTRTSIPPEPAAGGAPAFADARILVVDDHPANVRLLNRLLERDGYTGVRGVTDSGEALALLDAFQPDLVILDLHMPFPDGFVLLEHIGNTTAQGSYVPVLVLTGDVDLEAKHRALALGARDFLTKPFEPMEARYRVRNLLLTRRLHLDLVAERAGLEERVRARTAELLEARAGALVRLTRAAAVRDDQTGLHTLRVGELSASIARQLGLPDDRVEAIRIAAPLHDIGKIGIPDAILHKPGELTAEEREAMRRHTVVGAELLSGGGCATLELAERIAAAHHERWDGGGYPRGLAGEEIPLAARIVAVADFFDAVTHERPYRGPWSREEALEEIRRERGGRFDPRVVDALLRLDLASAPGGGGAPPRRGAWELRAGGPQEAA